MQMQRNSKVDKLLCLELGKEKGCCQVEELPHVPGLFPVGVVVVSESGVGLLWVTAVRLALSPATFMPRYKIAHKCRTLLQRGLLCSLHRIAHFFWFGLTIDSENGAERAVCDKKLCFFTLKFWDAHQTRGQVARLGCISFRVVQNLQR